MPDIHFRIQTNIIFPAIVVTRLDSGREYNNHLSPNGHCISGQSRNPFGTMAGIITTVLYSLQSTNGYYIYGQNGNILYEGSKFELGIVEGETTVKIKW